MSRDPAADAAFTEFATASRTRLRNTAYLLCGDWDQAADHVQEGLIRVYVAWPRLVRGGGELAYARKAVISAFLDASRKRSSHERATDVSSARASDEDVATAVTDRAALMAALAQLPERRRACIVLRYFEDLDVGDTATALGCSEGTVKSQTSRALETLRSVFAASACDGLTVPGDGCRPW